MNPDVKAQWVAALRSGEYIQGRAALHSLVEGIQHRYCCLGVLCDISRLGEWNGPIYLGQSACLPSEVMEWAGLTQDDPLVETSAGAREALSYLNDTVTHNHRTFDQIADVIEAQL